MDIYKDKIKTDFGIYIHIPFCIKKCLYCDFLSFANCNENIFEKYVEKTIEQIKSFKFKGNITSIYIGGGTPSILDSKLIQKIFDTIKNKYNLSKNCEITIEVNPGTINLEKLKKYKECGINRISFGLQSTNNYLLKQIGRIHKKEELFENYEVAKSLGFNINLDFILALPNQTIEDINIQNEYIKKLMPNHVSIYSLIIEPNTPFYEMELKHSLNLPSDELERKFYFCTKKFLEDLGYIHYEISNFAKKGYESKHNLNCWDQKEYIGFGLGASSYINGIRFKNTSNLDYFLSCSFEDIYYEDFINNKLNIKGSNNIELKKQDKKETLDKKLNKIIIEETQTIDIMQKEFMILGFRKIDGILDKDFVDKFGISMFDKFSSNLSKLKKLGLINITKDRVFLTKLGLSFANIVFEEFI